ncbi:MAG: tRNA-dihydrouridine synthase [Parcubacteria group bacterium]|jgi:nifR3 family TIM-barrel protein
MNDNFWKKLPKPFFALAPMLDITDSPFRQIVSECGKPDVFYTWFVSVDGLCSVGKNNLLSTPNINFTEKEKPIVIQLFGKDPEKFFESAKIMAKLGFDGIDINMGCPDKDVLKQGAGAQLIKNPKLAREIIRATKRGAQSASRRIPVSVKTRVGFYKSDEMNDWIMELAREKPSAICLHGRTAKQKYGGTSDWKNISEAVRIMRGSGIIIIGNGDVKNMEEGRMKAEKSGADGIMIGREILNNSWIFDKNKKEISKDDKLKMLVKHAILFEKHYKNIRKFGNFRKYFKCYISGFEGAKEIRENLMKAKNGEEIKKIFLDSKQQII